MEVRRRSLNGGERRGSMNGMVFATAKLAAPANGDLNLYRLEAEALSEAPQGSQHWGAKEKYEQEVAPSSTQVPPEGCSSVEQGIALERFQQAGIWLPVHARILWLIDVGPEPDVHESTEE